MIAWDDIVRVLDEHRALQHRLDHFSNSMARLLVGRLHSVSRDTLRQLKRELLNFDSTRGNWK